ncbi:MAG TPA: hypothetical protein VI362_02250 [Ignavibacteriaceae bacterium]|nr:hypothetical protein [Ignavibacteriaceae bacterium]
MNKTLHRIYIGSFFAIGIIVTILLTIHGFDYYNTSLEERFFNEQHNELKPSGTLGHGFGIVGSLMMIIGVATYMVRKRYRKLFSFGYLKHWLEFHIFLCTVGPILVLYHTAFKFGGIVSVSFWSMVLVVLSGVVGRFIYVQIPRTIQGKELSIQELNNLKADAAQKVRRVLSEDTMSLSEYEKMASPDRYKNFRLTHSIGFFIKDFFNIRKVMHQLNQNLMLNLIRKIEREEILKAARAEIVIARRIGLLRTFHKLFHYWHLAHLPFAITMFVIMLIHVLVTIIFGYKWIF